jgi:hypothetical protein
MDKSVAELVHSGGVLAVVREDFDDGADGLPEC